MMTLNYRIRSVLLVAGFIILYSCNKDSDNEVQNTAEEDIPLTEEQSAFLETVKDTVILPQDIIMSNGQDLRSFLETYDPGFLNELDQTIQEKKSGNYPKSQAELTPRLQKETFLARMLIMGEYLVDRSRHTYPAGKNDEPAQTGLAYSWGSKDYNIRQLPPGATNQCLDKKVYGLDCTGMIWAMTTGAKLPPVEPKFNFFVERISDASKWTNAFKASEDFKDLKMEDKGKLAKGDMKNGDIIIWGSHIGVYLYGFMYQSNGTPRSPGCDNNLLPSRGPRMISVSEVLQYGLGSYKVFRVTSGDDYTLTIEANFAGYGIFCPLGNYIESAVINITVKEHDVVLNYINNYDPAISFSQLTDCKCVSVTFPNKSALEFTNFIGHMMSSGYLHFDLEYSLSGPTETIQCGSAPPIKSEGYVATGIHIQDTVRLPKADETALIYKIGIYNGGKMTVARDN